MNAISIAATAGMCGLFFGFAIGILIPKPSVSQERDVRGRFVKRNK